LGPHLSRKQEERPKAKKEIPQAQGKKSEEEITWDSTSPGAIQSGESLQATPAEVMKAIRGNR
jgi:hypothetical protein